MAAPRATQLLALRRVTAITERHLHMTGPATFSSPLLSSTTERPAGAIPNASISLENTSTRRPSTSPFTSNGTADSSPVNKPVRHFNTSRALKAVNDTSTIDFAYLPDFDPDLVQAPLIRVPLMPENFSPKRDGVHAPEVGDEAVMRPQISSMSADSTYSPVSEVHDNNSVPIDFHAVADRVSAAATKIKEPVQEQVGAVKQLWDDVLEDVLGPKGKKSMN